MIVHLRAQRPLDNPGRKLPDQPARPVQQRNAGVLRVGDHPVDRRVADESRQPFRSGFLSAEHHFLQALTCHALGGDRLHLFGFFRAHSGCPLRQRNPCHTGITCTFSHRRLNRLLFADITEAQFDLLTWRKGPAPDVPADAFTTITCADDRGREHHYDLADTTITLTISQGPRKGQTVPLRQVTRRVPARHGGTRQIHALTSRTDLAAGELCWRLTSRWREENYFRYARTHFALDALDSHAATPDDPARLVPNPAKKAAAAQVRHAEILAAAAQAQRDASLAALRNPPPGQPVTITNQMINALDAPAENAWRELQAAQDDAAAVPARIRLAEIAPDMVRLEAEVKQITHAIRMAAYNTETTLARALDGHYARAGDEAYALIREALTTSGDICPGNGQLLIRLDPLTAPRRTQALAALCDQLNQTHACYPGTDLALRYEVKPHPGIA